MARLDIAGGMLVLRLGLLERITGFVGGNAQIPLTAIVAVHALDNPWPELRGRRSPGTHLGKLFAIGSWRFHGGKDFVALHGRGPGIVVELVGLEYARFIVSVAEAGGIAEAIEFAAREARR